MTRVHSASTKPFCSDSGGAAPGNRSARFTEPVTSTAWGRTQSVGTPVERLVPESYPRQVPAAHTRDWSCPATCPLKVTGLPSSPRSCSPHNSFPFSGWSASPAHSTPMVNLLSGSYFGPRYCCTADWHGAPKLLISTDLATSNLWSSRHCTNDGLSGASVGHVRHAPLWALLNTTLARLPAARSLRVSGTAVSSWNTPPVRTATSSRPSAPRLFARALRGGSPDAGDVAAARTPGGIFTGPEQPRAARAVSRSPACSRDGDEFCSITGYGAARVC